MKMLQLRELKFFDTLWIHLFGEYVVVAYTKRNNHIFGNMESHCCLLTNTQDSKV